MSVLERLVQGADGGNAVGTRTDGSATSEGGDETTREEAGLDVADEGQPKTAADRAREIIAGVPELYARCVELSDSLRTEMEKTASEGGDASEAEEASAFFRKIAQALSVQRSYTAALAKQGEANARTCEALKVASDLMQRDLLEVGEDQTMAQAVEELAKKDLKAVKVASEMFREAAFANAMGTAEKIASDKNSSRRLDGSNESWAEAHSWLLQ